MFKKVDFSLQKKKEWNANDSEDEEEEGKKKNNSEKEKDGSLKELKAKGGVFRVHGKIKVYDKVSLRIFKYKTRFRYYVVWLIEWK
jgi:hypothetical protein